MLKKVGPSTHLFPRECNFKESPLDRSYQAYDFDLGNVEKLPPQTSASLQNQIPTGHVLVNFCILLNDIFFYIS